jgi:hypothetical protein
MSASDGKCRNVLTPSTHRHSGSKQPNRFGLTMHAYIPSFSITVAHNSAIATVSILFISLFYIHQLCRYLEARNVIAVCPWFNCGRSRVGWNIHRSNPSWLLQPMCLHKESRSSILAPLDCLLHSFQPMGPPHSRALLNSSIVYKFVRAMEKACQ